MKLILRLISTLLPAVIVDGKQLDQVTVKEGWQ